MCHEERTSSEGKNSYNVGAPMECTVLDVLGPLPVSNDGNKHLLIAMDYFTK